MLNIKITLNGVDEMQRQLETMAKRSVPFAARETLNTLAFKGRGIYQEEMVAANLTLRNKFTARRALVETCRTLKMSSMEASLGHTEDYMRLLEFGLPEKAAKNWRPIPTEIAAGQSKGSLRGGRKAAVKKRNIIKTLGSLKSKAGGGSRKARNARAIRGALKSGKRLALLDMGRRKGIYRIKGSKRKPEILKLYDLSQRVTPMPKTPLLQRTLTKTLALAPGIAYTALLKQLQRNKVAGY